MFIILTLAALVFLIMHWEYVAALIGWCILGALCLLAGGIFLTLVTLFWMGVARI